VSLEAFHFAAGRGQAGWAGEYDEDQLVLNLGRTFRTGPEPEYLAVWYNRAAGLGRIGDWHAIFQSGVAAHFEEPFRLAARIDVAGCYEPLLDPVPGSQGPYYGEWFDVAGGATRDDVRALYEERRARHGELELNLLVDRIGKLGPDPRGLAIWRAPSFGALETIARELDVEAARAQQTAALVGDEGGRALALTADVSVEDEVRVAVDAVVEAFGALHVLWCNAGIWIPGDGPVTELDPAAWERTLAVNLNGVFHCCRHAIPRIVEAGGGSVITTSSPVAVRPEPVYDAYVASKGAVLSLTRSIAQYHALHGVRANVLMPGGVESAMTRAALEDPAYRAYVLRNTPLGRIGRPEDVAYAALYLASDESSWVTGSVQWVDGGWLLGPEQEEFGAV
jgi:NAD(P)-dependent dehydrogenase (short-subunit alcohol dehydrogenase family)